MTALRSALFFCAVCEQAAFETGATPAIGDHDHPLFSLVFLALWAVLPTPSPSKDGMFTVLRVTCMAT